MLVLEHIEPTRKTVREAQRRGRSVGLVPTMGALHDGHLSLIGAARRRCSFVAVTIFVNPTQFAPGEDYAAYPRTFDADLEACRDAGVDLVFAPSVETMYPPGAKTTVHVSGLTDGLCGSRRPGHFDGVATIVTKLFNILPADRAFFGEKDYQQAMVIRRMCRDLDVPIHVVTCPTVREADGLALSSRNAYLTDDERRRATSLSRALFAARDRIAAGQRDGAAITQVIREEILSAGPVELEYVELVDAESLDVLPRLDRPARICVAARFGSCRLIDNVAVNVPEET